MKTSSIISLMLLFTVLLVPYSQGVRILEDQETMLTGSDGETVTYTVIVSNDEFLPIDIQLREENSEWEVRIYDSERLEVQPGDVEEFTVDVTIPKDSDDDDKCISTLRFHQKRSYNIFESYEKDQAHELETSVGNQEDSNPIQTLAYFTLTFLIIGAFSYIWYGRKYFLIAPFYTTIPKDRIFDQKNREIVSEYLVDHNGSNLSEISNGTGIHLQTLRHHLKLFEQYNLIVKKEKRYFLKKPGMGVIDTEVLSPVLQRLVEVISNSGGISLSQIAEETKRSKPWVGNRIHDLLKMDMIEIVVVGRFKYIYLKGTTPNNQQESNSSVTQSMAG